jgi:hypothetical protein
MPTYTQLITTAPTASGDGEPMFEFPKLFDAPGDKAASHEGAAEADRLMAAGAQWVSIDVLVRHGGRKVCPTIQRSRKP